MRIIRFIKILWRHILYGNRVDFKEYARRIDICGKCPNAREDWTCGICGCKLDKKSKKIMGICKDGRW